MLQSTQVREIMSHATPSEKRTMTVFGALYGLWCANARPMHFTRVAKTPQRFHVMRALTDQLSSPSNQRHQRTNHDHRFQPSGGSGPS